MSIFDNFRIPSDDDLTVTYHFPKKGSWDVSELTPRQRLEKLRDFLRTPVPNLAWDFGSIHVNQDCGTNGCACGWYSYLTDNEDTGEFGSQEMLDHFGFSSWSDFDRLFDAELSERLNKKTEEVTPVEVADAIDEYLAEEAA